MKVQTPSTFVLNRNDKQYFLVEGKISVFKEPYYNVYDSFNGKPVLYNVENYMNTYGLDEKQTILKFTKKALNNLQFFANKDKTVYDTCNRLQSIYMKVKSLPNEKKPKLNSVTKQNFLIALESYNNIIDRISKIDFSENILYQDVLNQDKLIKYVDYEKDYVLVTDESELKKDIISVTNMEENAEVKGMQRKRTKEAA